MASTRDIRRRIKSIGSTAQITRAMQMVAASKMRRAQQAAIDVRPFVQRFYHIQRIATTRRGGVHAIRCSQVREVRTRAVILVASDKGLCGALNSNLFRIAGRYDPQSTRCSSRPGARRRSSWRARGGSSSPSSRTATRRAMRNRGRLRRWPATCS